MLTIPHDEWHLVAGGGRGGDIVRVAGAIGAGIGVSGSIAAAGGLAALPTMGAATCAAAVAGFAGAAYAGWSVGSYIGHNTWVRNHLSDFMTDLF